MSTHYTMSRLPVRVLRYISFIGKIGLPLLLGGATLNAWLDSESLWLSALLVLSIFYILIRISYLISRSKTEAIFFSMIAVLSFVAGIYMTFQIYSPVNSVAASTLLLFSFVCGLLVRTELQAQRLAKLESPSFARSSQARAEDFPGIYRITCKPNGMQYIGQTARSIKERWHDHISDLNAGRHHNDRWQHDWAIYRPEQFEWEILEVVTDQAWLHDRERYWQNDNYETSKRYNPPNTPRIARMFNKRPKRNSAKRST